MTECVAGGGCLTSVTISAAAALLRLTLARSLPESGGTKASGGNNLHPNVTFGYVVLNFDANKNGTRMATLCRVKPRIQLCLLFHVFPRPQYSMFWKRCSPWYSHVRIRLKSRRLVHCGSRGFDIGVRWITTVRWWECFSVLISLLVWNGYLIAYCVHNMPF